MARSFTLIGPGRAGRSVATALTELGWSEARTYRRGDDVADAAADVDVCIIATPDAAIEATAASIDVADAVVLHLSGATPLDAIRHHDAAALHPLVSLADPGTGAQMLREAWFAVAGDPVAIEMASALSGRWFEIADEDRVLYHAAAAVAANHLVALLGQVERIAAEVDVPLDALIGLARGSLDNVAALGPADALTGPASRGDDETIERHREQLRQRLPDELPAYDALVDLARRLAAG